MARKNLRRGKRSKGRTLALAVILVIVIAVGVSAALPATGFFTFLVPPSSSPPEKSYGLIEEALLETGDVRPTNRPDYLPQEVYRYLPEFPKDFYYLDEIITFQEGIVDLETLEEQYYKQPEFYPTWESNGMETTRNPDRTRAILWGWGAYPADQGFSTFPGAEFTATTFFHSSWGVQTYQGMKLVPVFPASAQIKGITVLSRDTEKYFTVTPDPDLILLGPTFPRFDFDWTQKVKVRIKVAENTPPGDYLIGVNPTFPPLEVKKAWVLQHKLKYVDAGATGIQRPYFQVLVTVLPPEPQAE